MRNPNKELVTNLVGRSTAKRKGFEHCWPTDVDGPAEIVAVWLDEDRSLCATVRDARGRCGKVYVGHVLVTECEEAVQ